MCGITGIFGLEGLTDPRQVVAAMNRALAHRGPDASGVWADDHVAFGHQRLSIIDLGHASDQPFLSLDGRYTLVFNGEIYNYRELRAQLEPTGWVFRTASDTEVLLAAFATWGEACLHRLFGMFAFALWDAKKEELFLARDRMGIKPLYVARGDRHFVFASELRAVLASGLVPRKVDREALIDHLRYQTVHAPATMARDVRMLEAGHCMRITDQEVTSWRWYDLVAQVDKQVEHLPLREVHRGVRERLERAVERRLVADVPFGAFLSGGIDSSIVVGLMTQASSSPVHTFSVIFNEPEFSEERYARVVSDRFRTDHTAIRLHPQDMLETLPAALAAMDHPSADGPNTFVVSKVTRAAGITMALSGLGGDEVFAGYPVFERTLALWQRRWITQFPAWARGIAARVISIARPSISSDKLGELLRLPSFSVDDTFPVSRITFSDRELARLVRAPHLPANAVGRAMHDLIRDRKGHELPLLSQVSLGELSTYLQSVLLRDTDQMSMAHALEVRVPFLDHELVEFALGVNDRHKHPHTPKKLLVDSMGDLLPPEIVNRPKMGFTLPWEPWMRGELRSWCEQRVVQADQRPWFRPGAVAELWNRFLRHDPRVNWSRLWSLIVLEDWLARHGMEE
ncbi:MAG: asparagine synthase (glutamine-hydrolyzing) [Flavobacteriales bacterium]|nr:asparagine synthase (glutamine-hydrolyzing) [Flavobacteriales bacterium]